MYCLKSWLLTGIFRLFCMPTASNASCGGDRMQIQKVVNNLLSNAFKYTSDGGTIRMELADGTEECMFSVSDNGAGISEEDYVKIFERFYQVENIGQYGGTGIGLALSQGIVKAHQGDITVESQLGKGSCFKVTLKKRGCSL